MKKRKRIDIGKFTSQFFILPAMGILKRYENDFAVGCYYEHIHITFAWLNRGLSIRIFTREEGKKAPDFIKNYFGLKNVRKCSK